MRAGRRENHDAGTIMVDALVAVVIVSLMISACLLSLNLSHKLSADARRIHQARLVLAAELETTPRVAGQYSGTRDGLNYAVKVTPDAQDGLCQIEAQTLGAKPYRIAATRPCPPEVPN